MSPLKIKKIVGAVVFAGLMIWFVNLMGDALVQPGERAAPAAVSVAGKAPAATVKAKPAAKAAKLARITPLLAKASAANGKKLIRKCATCHTLNRGGKKKLGPNLWNVVNAAKAGKGGFSYSKAMRGKGGKWSYEDLNAFIANPRAFIKGTKMAFGGIKKARDRAALIKYLRSLSASPAPLP